MLESLSGLQTRVVTSVVVLLLVFALTWIPALAVGLALFVAAVVAVGISEYLTLARTQDTDVMVGPTVGAGVLVVLSAYRGDPMLTSGMLAAASATVAVLHLWRRGTSIRDMAVAVFGVIYVSWFAAHVVLLHGGPAHGAGLVTLLIAAVALSDTGAYFVGKNFGKRKFAPVISPNKTWEGAAGGAAATVVGLLIVCGLARAFDWSALPDWTYARYAALGIALTCAAQLGDLLESSLKRNAGFKDSGVVFPGHGGVLDRCDGFLFAAPVLYYISTL